MLDYSLWPAFIVLGITALVIFCKIPRRTRVLLFFPLFPTVVMQGLALLQVRWGLIVMGLWLVCAVMVLVVYFSGDYPGRIPAPFRWLLMAIIFIAIVSLPLRMAPILLAGGDLTRDIPKDLAPTIILRDIAHKLIQSNPDRLPMVLSGVNSSTDLTYYGGIRTLGTLYWENLPGLERAARIFAAPTDEEAKQLILRAGVTHIVIASWDDFGEAYVRLLKMSGKIPPSDSKTFLAELIEGKECPDWLRPLFYPVPQAFGLEDQKVKIFAVMPDQSPQEALINRGIYFLDAGDFNQALEILKQAQKNTPNDPKISALLSRATARNSRCTRLISDIWVQPPCRPLNTSAGPFRVISMGLQGSTIPSGLFYFARYNHCPHIGAYNFDRHVLLPRRSSRRWIHQWLRRWPWLLTLQLGTDRLWRRYIAQELN